MNKIKNKTEHNGNTTLTKEEFEILVSFIENANKQLSNLSETDRQTLNELIEKGYICDNGITGSGIKAMEPYMVKRAVFLAAGFGARLMPITVNTPKPLVRVHGQRIIDGLIDACIKIGIEEIYIVRGYLLEQFDQLLYKYPMIKFINNHAYNETNNISSALAAKHLLQNAYVFEADLLLHNLGVLKKYHYTSNFLGFETSRTDDWCFKVEDGIIVDEKIGGEGDNIWQMIGISYWNKEDGKRLAADITNVYNSPGGKERYWEQVPLVHRKSNYEVRICKCTENDVTEIDTLKELKTIDKTYAI